MITPRRFAASTTRRGLVALSFIALLLGPRAVGAHGPQPTEPTGDQATIIQPPAAGAMEFAEAMARNSRYLFSSDEMSEFELMTRYFAVVRDIEKSPDAAERQREVGFNRTLGQGLLASFVAKYDRTVVFDFTTDSGKKPDIDHPLKVPASNAPVLVKIVTGEGPTTYTTARIDIAHVTEPQPLFPITIGATGTTWALLEMENIPAGRGVYYLSFAPRGAEAPRYYDGMVLESPRPGTLQLTVLDENGRDTPVLMRLTAADTGKLFRPANALDFTPMMDDISGNDLGAPGKAHPYYTPADYKGWYWVVPGPLSMAIPPGRWEVRLLKGIEYEPLVTTLEVTSDEVTSRSLAMKRWVNMPERGWWSGDDHVHSRLMSDDDAAMLLSYTIATDTHVANILQMGNEARMWYEQRGFGAAFRSRRGPYALVPGQEDPRYRFGHAIGLNLKWLVRDLNKYMLNDWVADEIHAQGGLYGHTHVGHKMFNVERDMTLLIPREKSDFNSILQGFLGTDYYYDFLDLGYRLTASAGSDIPYGASIGQVRVYCYTGAGKPFDIDAWYQAMKDGHTFVSNGPMIDLKIGDSIPGDTINAKAGDVFEVHARAWAMPGVYAPKSLKLVVLSDTFAEATSMDNAQTSLELARSIPAGDGFWIAARAECFDGTVAHTTPIYVQRDGLRHWNFPRVPELLQRRFATLDDIDAMIADLDAKAKAGQVSHLDFYSRWAIEQGPQVTERTEMVRGLYRQLEQTHAAESALRGGLAPAPSPVSPSP